MTVRHSPAQFAGKRPSPKRITLALDSRDLYGPEVDLACGVEEPAVDEWEAGTRIPTFEQMEALAELTGYPIGFFYRPDPEPITNGFICVRSGKDRGCHFVDERPKAPITRIDGQRRLF